MTARLRTRWDRCSSDPSVERRGRKSLWVWTDERGREAGSATKEHALDLIERVASEHGYMATTWGRPAGRDLSLTRSDGMEPGFPERSCRISERVQT